MQPGFFLPFLIFSVEIPGGEWYNYIRKERELMAIPEARKYTEEEYLEIAGDKRCELINGYIVDMSPAASIDHQWISANIHTDIMNYIRSQKGKCRALATPQVKFNDDLYVVPDIIVACNESKMDGKKHYGAPDWVIEIVSPGNVSNDYYNKVNLYKENGVKEYWIVDPRKFFIMVHIWDGDFSDVVNYNWNEDIPVYIYKDRTPQLIINIARSMEEF